MPVKKSGLKLLVDYLDMNNLAALGVLQVLFSLYGANRPLTVKEMYPTGSGYRRVQLNHMLFIGLLKRRRSQFQVKARRTEEAPSAYALTTKGRYQVNRLIARESPDIDDCGNPLQWLRLIQENGITTFAKLRMLVNIDENPGQCGKELYVYHSGSLTEMMEQFQRKKLVKEVLVGGRKEKYPGKNWKVLRGYLNRPMQV